MKIPVVISTYNRLKLLQQTLESLRKNTDNELEIVVVDDVSTDLGVVEYLKSQKDIILYQFKDRVRIVDVKNKGIELSSKTEYICIADNDVYFMPHWDTIMIKVLETFPDIGLVGGKHHPHLRIFERRSIDKKQVLVTELQPGYHLFLKRKVFDALGEIVSNSDMTYGHEDTIICEKVKKMGFQVAAIEPPVIYHCGMNNLNGLAADYREMLSLALQHPEIKFL